ncbi:VTT domain-containing protein [Paenibacillus sp. JCM 10914]|uniref:TVP38/TMEM64 family protein n=1 Tax=Paenibacillus sp. JCM 10914 TaxID=1236974 RepID=UPI0003CCAEF9|nr:TVP38/TMEM64 family protein [Paenibacillus sp. JCM 10914]GAE05075.1 alkaline phosphatase like protein [Paenibacillus sp. JCM 10914]
MMEWFHSIGTNLKHIDLDQVQGWLQQYSRLGPLPGILLPFIEAFLPVLPLIVLVMGNSAAYGLWWGFLFSWIGVCLGSITVFWIVRKLGGNLGVHIQRRIPGSKRFFHWIEEKGFTPIFILYCFPFTPSSLVNIASGLSTVSGSTFMIAVMAGKSVMIFMVAFIGHDWQAFIYQPWRILIAALVLWLLWFAGKRMENRYHSDEHLEPILPPKK